MYFKNNYSSNCINSVTCNRNYAIITVKSGYLILQTGKYDGVALRPETEVKMSITIRRAAAEDAQKVLDFMKLCGSETDNLSFGAEGISVSAEEEEDYLRSMENSEQHLFLLAKDGEEIIGTASYSTLSGKRMCHRGELGISIRKSYWSRGIGSLFLKRLLDFARNSAKAEVVSLEVRSDNTRAIHLYEKYDFKKIGTFKGYFKINGELIDFDIMQRLL